MIIAFLVFFPMLFGAAAWLAGRKDPRRALYTAIWAVILELILTLFLQTGERGFAVPGVFAGGLSFQTDGFRRIYCLTVSILWTGSTVFSLEYFRHEPEHLDRLCLFWLITLGAVQGVMLSADFMTAFIFFEILSFTSFVWVLHEETKEAVRAAYTYLFVAIIGGMILFFGLLLIWNEAGTLNFAELKEILVTAQNPGHSVMDMGNTFIDPGEAVWNKIPDRSRILAGSICVLTGFGAKAGMFPVHIWLPKAHPVAPAPASALLSGILTKVGIYGILMVTVNVMADNMIFGMTVLCTGMVTMSLGAVLALFSVNLKRTLACSSMSQIGFILTGTGMYVLCFHSGSGEGLLLSVYGTVLHMINHSFIKLTLFLSAGAAAMNLHMLDLNDIRGWGRNKAALKTAFGLGAAGISGIPLLNGYLSKTMLHEAIVHGQGHIVSLSGVLTAFEWIFLVSGGCTFAYMLKLFICLFVESNENAARQAEFDRSKKCMDPVSTAVVLGSSAAMVLLGIPRVSLALAGVMAPFALEKTETLHFAAFSPENLKGGAVSLCIGAILYFGFVRQVLMKPVEKKAVSRSRRRYINLWPAWLDLEELVFCPLLTKALPFVFGSVVVFFGENRILKPLSRFILEIGKKSAGTVMRLADAKTIQGILGLGSELSAFFMNIADTKTIKAALRFWSAVMRALDCGLDVFIRLLRKTIMRERRVKRTGEESLSHVKAFMAETHTVMTPVIQNFSFAIIMTCVGILLVLGVLVFYTFMK